MSLILEALRKLEREKQNPERGFLVVAASPWPEGTRRVPLWGAFLAALAVGIAAWLWPHRPAASAGTATLPKAAPAVVVREATPARATPPEPLLATQRASAPSVVRAPRAAQAAPAAAPSPPALVLEAISERDGHPIALVNDHLVREGEGFDGVTILRIGQAEVEVEWQGTRHILHF